MVCLGESAGVSALPGLRAGRLKTKTSDPGVQILQRTQGSTVVDADGRCEPMPRLRFCASLMGIASDGMASGGGLGAQGAFLRNGRRGGVSGCHTSRIADR